MLRVYVLAVMLLLTFKASALSDNAQNVRAFVDNLGKKVIAVIDSPSMNDSEKKKILQDMFSQNVDIKWMAKFVLGRGWNNATNEQRRRYMQAYQKYLVNNYTKRFSDYSGSQYKITDIRRQSNNQYIVVMNIKTNTQKKQEIQAGYWVRAQGGNFKISDIIIEGVSLIVTQREDFSSVLKRDGMEQLIKNIEAKSSDNVTNLFPYAVNHRLM
jgi:phospholipid transport system substrate-binding protein